MSSHFAIGSFSFATIQSNTRAVLLFYFSFFFVCLVTFFAGEGYLRVPGIRREKATSLALPVAQHVQPWGHLCDRPRELEECLLRVGAVCLAVLARSFPGVVARAHSHDPLPPGPRTNARIVSW